MRHLLLALIPTALLAQSPLMVAAQSNVGRTTEERTLGNQAATLPRPRVWKGDDGSRFRGGGPNDQGTTSFNGIAGQAILRI